MKKNYFTAGRSALAMAALSVAFLTSCEKESLLEDESMSAVEVSEAAISRGQEYVANEVLVKFKAGVSEETKAAVLARISGKVKEHILTKTMERFGDREGFLLVHTPMAALATMFMPCKILRSVR